MEGDTFDNFDIRERALGHCPEFLMSTQRSLLVHQSLKSKIGKLYANNEKLMIFVIDVF